MPFDPTPTERPAVSRNGVELAKLRVLEEALRAEMPRGFEWDFRTIRNRRRECGTAGCALGLANEIGIIPEAEFMRKFIVTMNGIIAFRAHDDPAFFGLSQEETGAIFYSACLYDVATMGDVTPIQVADELARIIAREEADTGA